MQSLQSNPKPSRGHNLDKLGQFATGTNQSEPTSTDNLNIHLSKGTDSNDKATISKRARSKYISSAIKSKLIQVESSALNEAYEKSCSCASIMKVERGKVSTSYCKQRWCITCNRIRTGMLLNNYLPHIKEAFVDPFFVTLTTPNCTAEELRATINLQLSTFAKVARTMKQRKARNDLRKFTAIVKLESTYNAKTNEYHPHLHCIIDTRDDAYEALGMWLKHHPEASIKGQNIRQADESSMKELLKYSTKMISELGDGNKSEDKEVNITALDTMFVAMKGIRLMRTYGNMHSISSTVNDEEMNEQEEKEEQLSLFDEQPKNTPSTGCYLWRGTDWYNRETGEGLTNYKPAPKTLEFIANMRL